jgi:hypothetical protein
MSPDQQRFLDHLTLPEYLAGVIHGFWGRVDEQENGPAWPFSLFWISVPLRGYRQVPKYFISTELSNYNLDAPAGCFWDHSKKCRLANELWPKVSGPFSQGFRTDYNASAHELYAPWDRGGLKAHPEWATANTAVSWKSGKSTIADYLSIMHEILNSDDYHGTNA